MREWESFKCDTMESIESGFHFSGIRKHMGCNTTGSNESGLYQSKIKRH